MLTQITYFQQKYKFLNKTTVNRVAVLYIIANLFRVILVDGWWDLISAFALSLLWYHRLCSLWKSLLHARERMRQKKTNTDLALRWKDLTTWNARDLWTTLNSHLLNKPSVSINKKKNNNRGIICPFVGPLCDVRGTPYPHSPALIHTGGPSLLQHIWCNLALLHIDKNLQPFTCLTDSSGPKSLLSF